MVVSDQAGPGTSSLFEATRLGLSRIALRDAGELTRALEHACKASAQALAVERVGIWFISDTAAGAVLRCGTLYEASQDLHSSGAVLSLALLPGYLPALEARRVLSTPPPAARPAPSFGRATWSRTTSGQRSTRPSFAWAKPSAWYGTSTPAALVNGPLVTAILPARSRT